MDAQTCTQHLNSTKEWFDRSTRTLTEEDSSYAPAEGLFTTAQHVAHVAQTIDWFLEGAFRPEGFEMDFEALDGEIRKVESLAAAREWLDRACAAAIDKISSHSPEELAQPLPEGPIMGGMPRHAILGAIQDHTAHHRGALTIYARLRGQEPAMPYMEM